MVDHKYFFEQSVKLGFTTHSYESLVNLHKNGAEALRIMGCKNVFEFGSGLGFFLSACQSMGWHSYQGYDINPYERDFAISKGIPEDKYILAKGKFKMTGKYDAIYCTEVFEHITDDELNQILPVLHKHCNKYFYFTSTPNLSPDPQFDKDWGHINIKQKDEWISLMYAHGFDFMHDVRDVAHWGIMFKKIEL